MNGSEELRRTYRETAIVCGALVASVLIYAVVVEVLRTRLRPGGAAPRVNADLLRYGFYLLAGVEGLAIPFVRRALEALCPGTERASWPGCGWAPWWRPRSPRCRP